ncbi:MAG: DNA alkylation repair protein [Eubacteriales bacterium]|nr:DNA alkylation repair protein [Eubacteriales bacterium]
MNFKQVCTEMIRKSDPEKGKTVSKYLQGRYEFLGIPAQVRREISKTYLSEENPEEPLDWEYVQACWDQLYREFQYLALDYLQNRASELTERDLFKLRRLVQEKPGWDISDSMGRLVAKITARHPKAKRHILEWAHYNDPSVRRIAIVHQIPLREDTDSELLTKILESNLDCQDSLVRRAIVWALSEYSKHNPDYVDDFIWQHGDKMTAEMRREAAKHLPTKQAKEDKSKAAKSSKEAERKSK